MQQSWDENRDMCSVLGCQCAFHNDFDPVRSSEGVFAMLGVYTNAHVQTHAFTSLGLVRVTAQDQEEGPAPLQS